jgi:hypothetical protein
VAPNDVKEEPDRYANATCGTAKMFSDIQKVPPAPAPNAVASVPSREPLRQQTDRTNERMHTLKEVQEYIHAIQLADAREKEKILAKFEEKERKLV